MSKNRLSAFSPNISKTPAAVKVIKSRYKLRKIAQNTFHTSKLKRTPMKTVVNSKYKLRKIPLSKSSYSVSSSNLYLDLITFTAAGVLLIFGENALNLFLDMFFLSLYFELKTGS
jgi:hypothetical protein